MSGTVPVSLILEHNANHVAALELLAGGFCCRLGETGEARPVEGLTARVLFDDSLSCWVTISSYFGIVVSGCRRTMWTTL
jgi:hypothetical protein